MTYHQTLSAIEAASPASIAADRRHQADLSLFYSVLRLVRTLTDLPGAVAINPDRDAVRSMKWRPELAHYTIDVDRAVRAALSPVLQGVWAALVLEDDPAAEAAICTRDVLGYVVKHLARVFRQRELSPAHYFKPCQRKPSPCQ